MIVKFQHPGRLLYLSRSVFNKSKWIRRNDKKKWKIVISAILPKFEIWSDFEFFRQVFTIGLFVVCP